jgi:quercetin dioxygenase-like cupin family protein
MSALPSEVMGAPPSLHRAEGDLPFVPYQEGVVFQLLQVNVEGGLWVIRVRFEPGVTIQRHRHTGEVFAFTVSGSWRYLEYPDINTAGSYLFEPAGAIHTLHVPATNKEVTDVWFAIRGANLNLDGAGNVETVLDAATVLEIYRAQCKAGGFAAPRVIGARRISDFA